MVDVARAESVELDPPINFRAHELRTGSIEGARSDFEQMIAQLVDFTLPGVRRDEANPGDWGIDAFIGSLEEGETRAIWQSKLFLDASAIPNRGQIGSHSLLRSQRRSTTNTRYRRDSVPALLARRSCDAVVGWMEIADGQGASRSYH